MPQTQKKPHKLTINKNKPQNKGYSVKLTPDLADSLRYLSDKSGRTQINILKSVLESMMSVAITYKKFTFEVFPDRNTVLINFYGHGSNMISGKVTDDDDLAFAKLNKEISTKLLNQSNKKSKAMEIIAQ